MTGAPVPAGADAVVPYEWTDRGVAAGAHRARPDVAPARAPRGRGRRRSATCWSSDGTVLGPAPPRPAGRGRARHRALAPATARGGHLHRLRAARAGHGARPRLDLRRQLLPARRRRAPGRGDRLPGRHRARRAARVPRRAARPAGPRRPRGHQRRGQRGRLRRGQGGARAARHGLVRRGRDAARQAAGLRRRRRGPDPDLHAAGQPGLVLRLLRGVRAARDAPDDGPAPYVRPTQTRPAHPRAALARRAPAVRPGSSRSTRERRSDGDAGRRPRLAPDRRPGRRPTR